LHRHPAKFCISEKDFGKDEQDLQDKGFLIRHFRILSVLLILSRHFFGCGLPRQALERVLKIARAALRSQNRHELPGFAGCLAIHPAALAMPSPIYFQNTLLAPKSL